ncbi:MAG: fasciclin domain-containing protein [Cyclobacteriaceae bacterium]
MKNLINPLKALAMFAVAFGLIFTVSCSDDDEDDKEPDPTESLQQIIAGNSNYSDFKFFYEANSTLLPDISGSTEFTVFVPNNEAFDALRETLDTDDLTTVSPEVIASVLAFHFVSGQVLEDEFGTEITTAQGEKITWNSDNTIVEGGSNTAVAVVSADQKATNGVIHEVERILIPPTIFLQIGLNLGTMAQPILLGSVFSDLRQIITVADSDIPDGEMGIAQILADQTSETGYTCFVPANDVLDGVAAAAKITKEQLIASVTTAQGDFTASQVARGFLLNHIYDGGILTAADILATVDSETGVGTSLVMMGGKTLTVLAIPSSSEQAPAGCTNGGDTCIFLVQNIGTESAVYTPIFVTDAFDYNDFGSGTNGAVHVSSIVQ